MIQNLQKRKLNDFSHVIYEWKNCQYSMDAEAIFHFAYGKPT